MTYTEAELNEKLRAVITGAKGRCYNPNNKKYKNYGARGVTVYKNWKENSKQFIQDAKELPGWDELLFMAGKLRLDKDFNGSDKKTYSPETCQWITNETNVKIKPSYMYWHYAFNVDTLELVEFYNATEFSKQYEVPYRPLQMACSEAKANNVDNVPFVSGKWFIFSKHTMNRTILVFRGINLDTGEVVLKPKAGDLATYFDVTPSVIYKAVQKGVTPKKYNPYVFDKKEYALEEVKNLSNSYTKMILSNKN